MFLKVIGIDSIFNKLLKTVVFLDLRLDLSATTEKPLKNEYFSKI